MYYYIILIIYGYSNFQNSKHELLIEKLVKLTNCQTYLELGVQDGFCFQPIVPLVKRAIGVDIVDRRSEKIGEFYNMSTDEFFKFFNDKVDIIFIDADHKYESVVKDFENCLKILNEFGIILLHDTDPQDKPLLAPHFCNDCYKIVDYIQQNHPELNIITLPLTIAGLSIVMRKTDRRINKFI